MQGIDVKPFITVTASKPHAIIGYEKSRARAVVARSTRSAAEKP